MGTYLRVAKTCYSANMGHQILFYSVLLVTICQTLSTTGLEHSIANAIKSLSKIYSVFHQFWQAKFAYGGSILSSSQFLLLHQLPQKMELASKVVKVGSKIIVSLFEI